MPWYRNWSYTLSNYLQCSKHFLCKKVFITNVCNSGTFVSFHRKILQTHFTFSAVHQVYCSLVKHVCSLYVDLTYKIFGGGLGRTTGETWLKTLSKNQNLKGNESKIKYYFFKIINLDKPEQITFIPRNLIIYTHWWWEPRISRLKHSRISAELSR